MKIKIRMVDEVNVQSLALPVSGRILQWRSDGSWRELTVEQHRDEANGIHHPLEDEWINWSGVATQPQAAGGGQWDGGATWWLLYGELPDATSPDVVLADGQRPAVLTVGRVWGCEWMSPAQPATLYLGRAKFTVPFAEPFYRRHLT